jgi:hypothetical protein
VASSLVSPTTGKLVTQNSYTGVITIYAGATLEVTGSAGASTIEDGTTIAFGSATSNLQFDVGSTLTMGQVSFTTSEGHANFYGTTTFSSTSASTSTAAWYIGDGTYLFTVGYRLCSSGCKGQGLVFVTIAIHYVFTSPGLRQTVCNKC